MPRIQAWERQINTTRVHDFQPFPIVRLFRQHDYRGAARRALRGDENGSPVPRTTQGNGDAPLLDFVNRSGKVRKLADMPTRVTEQR